MNDLLRPSFYNAYHQVLPINEKNTTGIQAQWDLVCLAIISDSNLTHSS
jgi:diaminopimelate decarboxylase